MFHWKETDTIQREIWKKEAWWKEAEILESFGWWVTSPIATYQLLEPTTRVQFPILKMEEIISTLKNCGFKIPSTGHGAYIRCWILGGFQNLNNQFHVDFYSYNDDYVELYCGS